MPSKDQIARQLIAAHFGVEPHLQMVYRIVTENEWIPTEPIKLLEVNAATVSTHAVMPFAFAPTENVPFATVIAEVTPAEFTVLVDDESRLPSGWSFVGAQRFTRADLAA